MIRYSKKISWFFLPVLIATGAFSQQRTTYAEDMPGKITGIGPDVIYKRIDAVKNFDRSKVPSLKKCIAEQLKIFYADPLFHPPKGFIAQTGFYTEKDPFAKSVALPPCVLSFGFYYLENDKRNGGVKKSMDGTLMGMETNNLSHFFRQVGNYWKDCDELKLPLFFEEPPVSDSTDDYIELDFNNYAAPHITPDKPFRIVLRNNRPLFVPLARKEFMQYLVAKKELEIKQQQKSIEDDEKTIDEQKRLLSDPVFQKQRQTIADGIEQIRKNISKENDDIQLKQQMLAHYKEIMTSMPSAEADAPVRIDYSKHAFEDPFQALVPIGRHEGTGLYKINPDYYDRSTAASGAQVIIVYYTLPRNFGPAELNYLEQKTVDIFNHLDYHALKMSMQ